MTDGLNIITFVNRSNQLSENEICELIEQIKQEINEEENFRLLYENFHEQICRFFFRCGENRENAYDLTQETFLSVYRGLKGFRGESKFKTWIFKLATNVLNDEIDKRNAARRKGVDISIDEKRDESEDSFLLADILPDLSPGQLDRLYGKEIVKLVRNAILELPPQQRQCLMLSLAELTTKEIASAMGIAEGTVKAHINQAKKTLKEKLSRYFKDTDF